MARIRTIKPEFWTDSMMVQFDVFTRLLYIGLWTAADDHGAIRDEPDRIAMEVMPREDPEIVKLNIDLLIASGRLSRMLNDDGTSYLVIDKWTDHQRVDKPSKSKIIRENSRKLAIPAESRRKVAIKYGCPPGEKHEASCYFCGAPGSIYWPRLYSGKPGGWVAFSELELDHFDPESKGGENTEENLVLSCRHCNHSRCNKTAFDFVTSKLSGNTREDYGVFMGGKEGKGREGNNPHSNAQARESAPSCPAAANSIIDNRPPQPGGMRSDGKFTMYQGWRPDDDFLLKAAQWGTIITEPPPETVLAEFVTYWQAEGKAFHHVQWEQKFAQSLKRNQFRKQTGVKRNENNIRADGYSGPWRGDALEQSIAAMAEQLRAAGHSEPEIHNILGGNGGNLFGQVASQERDGTVITLEPGDYGTHQ